MYIPIQAAFLAEYWLVLELCGSNFGASGRPFIETIPPLPLPYKP